jgi:predicted DCC family thiol-disulfide oxidoreductase YuxK
VSSTSSSSAAGTAPLLLYDGACGFCAASVQFVLKHERRHSLRFAALESGIGREIRARHPHLDGVDSMVWVEAAGTERERVLARSSAALEVARYMGGVWRLTAVGRLVPRALRDAVYDFIARHRHSLVAEGEYCYIPPPAIRARFLDAR